MAEEKRKFGRVLLKLSGEALADKENGSIFDPEQIDRIAAVIAQIAKEGIELGIVIDLHCGSVALVDDAAGSAV